MFNLLAEIHPKYCPSATIYNWNSSLTGLQVVLIRQQTPAVNGYFTVPTEINDDSGCPHTLEHLVFMGSRNYPYKGLLDILGNKQLSSTNAWTSQDQTVYTLQTAGWEGFANLLPVYLDHILNATITDEACTTEVYHIDGEGQEKGVVFSEMQAVENTSAELMTGEAQRLLYKKHSGYASNTGGLMSALRNLSVQEIRDYHSKMYRPSNLCVIVTGDVEPTDLIKVLEPFDSQQSFSTMPRPFLDSPIQDSPLESSKIGKIEFPEQDEAFGEALQCWVGPPASDIVENTAIQVLKSYLTMEGVGKLFAKFVDVEDPLASDIYLYTNDYLNTVINIYLEGVPTEKLESVDPLITETIKQCVKDFDLKLVRDIIKRTRAKVVQNVENDPENFAYMAIDVFMYGKRDGSTIREWLSDISEYDILAEWNREQWQEFVHRYFVANCHATVLGIPSREKLKQLAEQNKARSKYIHENFDLKKQGKILEDATKANDIPIPDSVLEKFPTPDYAKIKFIETKSASTPASACISADPSLQSVIDSDTPANFGLPIHFESYPSEFVNIKIYLNAGVVNSEYLPLIDVVLTEVFSMPMILEDGSELSHEEVSQSVKRETLSNFIGTNGTNQELVMLQLRVHRAAYHDAVKWVERVIFAVKFDPQRVGIFVGRHLSSLAEMKRDGYVVLASSVAEETLLPKSLRRQSEGLVTEDLFENFDPVDLAGKTTELLSQLFWANNMRILVTGDIPRIENPVSMWQSIWSRLLSSNKTGSLTHIPTSSQYLSTPEVGRAYFTLCPATESSYLSLVGPAPKDYNDPVLPSLYLANAYLQVTEGPLWKAVRGAGLAYGATVSTSVSTGQQFCQFYRAADVAGSYQVTKNIVSQLATGATPIDNELYIGAISSLVNDLAQRLATPAAASSSKYFDDYIKCHGPNFVHKLITDVQKVKPQEFMMALNCYILPLFDASTSLAFVVGNPSQQIALTNYLERIGYHVELKEVAESLTDVEHGHDMTDSEDSDSSS